MLGEVLETLEARRRRLRLIATACRIGIDLDLRNADELRSKLAVIEDEIGKLDSRCASG